ncbi:unnamed protein product [Caenorhabditis bovis]|uniref:MHD domain-containing protein n=1 Tax=Caenorhabditis bovis TaxID=2654633 RepID=A0A8S1FAL6_9PELO|nr:unnamed protein product [Caenorhabditis bovis]
MATSAVFILDLKGKTIISRNYRGDVDMSAIDKFITLLMEKEEEGSMSPVITHHDTNFVFIKHANIYLVSVCRSNVNVTMILSFLYKLIEVFTEYFKDVEEESVRDNFVVIYELLDEMMDFGFPQTTESRILQEYITQEGQKLVNAPRPPMAVTNAVSWRSEGIKYRKNEVFLDVIESVNMLASANGTVLQSEIVGSVKMRVYLTGMPELRLGLNDKVLFEGSGRGKSKSVELEDVKFHQCVRLSRFDTDRTISFIPPDGAFELMSYRLTTVVKPLIWIETSIERHSHSRVSFIIKAKSQFKRRSTANNVEIIIPVNSDADSPKFKTSIGSVKYTPEQSAFIWTIKSFPGGKEYLLTAHFSLPSVASEESEGRPPIKVKFEIPYFTTSGIQVRYLKIIEKSGYQALPWVRYITQNGEYEMRMKKELDESSCWDGSEKAHNYPLNDLIPSKNMLDRIVEDLKNQCCSTFVIPSKQSEARVSIVENIEKLLSYGVKPEFVVDAAVKNPQFFRHLVTLPNVTTQILETLVSVAYLTFEDSIRLFTMFPDDFIRCGPDGIIERVESLSACGITSPKVTSDVIRKCPALAFSRDAMEMRKFVESIGSFFTRKQITTLISRSPHILLKNIEEVEEKYEYMFYQMGIESDELSESSGWIDELKLSGIIQRHRFLTVTGKYQMPDPKRPQLRRDNPKGSRIFDTNDEDFARNVAGVSLEEWVVFQMLQLKIEENQEKERPFERVKPSKRKAYERRHKQRTHHGDHIFDVSMLSARE